MAGPLTGRRADSTFAAANVHPVLPPPEEEVRQAVKKAGFTAGQIRFEAKPVPDRGEKSGAEVEK